MFNRIGMWGSVYKVNGELVIKDAKYAQLITDKPDPSVKAWVAVEDIGDMADHIAARAVGGVDVSGLTLYRYDDEPYDCWFGEDPTGEFVKLEDVRALLAAAPAAPLNMEVSEMVVKDCYIGKGDIGIAISPASEMIVTHNGQSDVVIDSATAVASALLVAYESRLGVGDNDLRAKVAAMLAAVREVL